jgi:hypothetical protein
MDWFASRLARRKEILFLFIACAMPIHFGSYLQFFLYYPANILKFDLAQLLGLFGYFSSFALLESTITLIVCITIGLITPNTLWEKKFPALLSSFILIFFFHGLVTFLVSSFLVIKYHPFFGIFFSLMIASCLFFLWNTQYKLYKFPEYEAKIFSLMDNLVPLIIIYLVVDFSGFAIVILRNIL